MNLSELKSAQLSPPVTDQLTFSNKFSHASKNIQYIKQ